MLFAHPDDAEFMCGGTVAKWARDGCEVHYIVCTDGSAGSNEPGARREDVAPIREREQRAAADVLGVKSIAFLGEPDGLLEVNPRTRKMVTREIRRIRPEVVVAPDPSRLWFASGYINHWDHKQAGLLALTAVMPDAPTRVMFQELEEEGLEPYEIPNLYLSGTRPTPSSTSPRRSRPRSRPWPSTCPKKARPPPPGCANGPARWGNRWAWSTPNPSRPSGSLTTMKGDARARLARGHGPLPWITTNPSN